MSMDRLDIARDGTGCARPSKHVDCLVLEPGAPKEWIVPAGAERVFFAWTDGANLWVAYDRPAAIPTADVRDGLSAEINPLARILVDIKRVSFLADAPCHLTIACHGG